MRPSTPPRMNVVRKEDKEQRLKEFILKDLSARLAAEGQAAPACYRLVALSAESPVAKALLSLMPELRDAGIDIEAIFVKPVTAGGAERAKLFDGASGIRCTGDVRLLDAHEQLVLGDRTAWVGDCMRRDPGKRDAYECYAEESPEAAAWALRSFRRLWVQAAPLSLKHLARAAEPALPMSVLEPLLAQMGDAIPAIASTRH